MNKLHVLQSGKGPRLLFLHGIGGSATAWGQQIERLSDDFSCIAPDLPGYGKSPMPAGKGLQPMLDMLVNLLEGTPCHVVGVSFGALLALALTRREPGLVQSLVLADATLGRGHLNDVARSEWLDIRRKLAQSLHDISEERADKIASRTASKDVIMEIASHMRRARPEGYMNVADVIAHTDARPWLPEITKPTLVLYGDEDSVTGGEVSNTLVALLPDARLGVITKCGHAPHLEQPDEFAMQIKRFVMAQSAHIQGKN